MIGVPVVGSVAGARVDPGIIAGACIVTGTGAGAGAAGTGGIGWDAVPKESASAGGGPFGLGAGLGEEFDDAAGGGCEVGVDAVIVE